MPSLLLLTLSSFTFNINYNKLNSRVNNNLNFQSLKRVIAGTECIEETISNEDINKKRTNSNKSKLIGKLFLTRKKCLETKTRCITFFNNINNAIVTFNIVIIIIILKHG